MRIVPGTNVFVSALIRPHGIPAQIFSHPAAFELATTEDILEELERVLHYSRIRKKYQLSEAIIRGYVGEVRASCEVVAVSEGLTGVSQDPDDDKFLACAEASGADTIVSGDPHLTRLGSYQGIRILTPRQFLETLDEAMRNRE